MSKLLSALSSLIFLLDHMLHQNTQGHKLKIPNTVSVLHWWYYT